MHFTKLITDNISERNAGRLAAAVMLLSPCTAMADMTAVQTAVKAAIAAIVDIIGVVMFVGGILFVIQGILKFKSGSRGEAEHGEGIKLVAIGVACIALPTFTGIGLSSFFGSGANTTSATSGNLSSINAQ